MAKSIGNNVSLKVSIDILQAVCWLRAVYNNAIEAWRPVELSSVFGWQAQSDFDNDGLGIATERGDVIGAWACFHIPDIFVEVDWIEGHEMSDEAVARVAWAFARHGIALHIDRGEMGGGTEVPHENPLTDLRFNDDAWSVPDINNPNTIYGIYFTDNRHHIFHYAFFCLDSEHDTFSWENWGMGAHPGDSFYIEDSDMNDALMEAVVFMHELGHNLGLDDNPPYTGTCMKQGATDILDYAAQEWATIDLAGAIL